MLVWWCSASVYDVHRRAGREAGGEGRMAGAAPAGHRAVGGVFGLVGGAAAGAVLLADSMDELVAFVWGFCCAE